jgi:hypothetical protein
MPYVYGVPATAINSSPGDIIRDRDRICVIGEMVDPLNGKVALVHSNHSELPVVMMCKKIQRNQHGKKIKLYVTHKFMRYMMEASHLFNYYETEEQAREIEPQNQKEDREK